MHSGTVDTKQPAPQFTQFYAWVSWSAAALFLVYQIGMQNALGSVQAGFEASLKIQQSDLAVISSAFFVSYALMQVPAGILIDRFGVGWIVPPACLLLGAGGFMLSTAESLSTAVAARLLMGFGGSFSFLAVAAVAKRRINEKRLNVATGLIDCSLGIGAILGAIGITALLGVMNWRSVLLLSALIAVPVAILNWFILGRGKDVSPAGPGKDAVFASGATAVFGSPTIWSIGFVYMAFIGIAFGMGGLWNEPLQQEFERTKASAAELTTIMFLSLSVGAPLSGLIADKIGRHYLMLFLGLVVAVAALYRIIFISTPAPFWVVAIDFGVLGAGLSVGILVFPLALGEVGPAHAGTACGLVNGIGLFGAGLFQFLPGVIRSNIDAQGLPALQDSLLLYVVWPGIAAVLLVGLAFRKHRLNRREAAHPPG